MTESEQHLTIPISPGSIFKELLIGTEYGRDQVKRDLPFLQFIDVMKPEFILYKENFLRLYQIDEFSGIAFSIGRKVKDIICQFIIFSDFVSRRRKECQENPVMRMKFPDSFYQWPALFKFPKRCTMYPDDWPVQLDFVFNFGKNMISSFTDLPGFNIEWGCKPDEN
jgi:hypothetical protein